MEEVKGMIENLKTFISALFKGKEAEAEVVDQSRSEYEAKVSEIEAKYQDFQAAITEKDAEITELKAALDTVGNENEKVKAELEAMKALPVDVKTTDPDIGETKKEGNPFDEVANEMKTKLY